MVAFCLKKGVNNINAATLWKMTQMDLDDFGRLKNTPSKALKPEAKILPNNKLTNIQRFHLNNI